MQISVIGLGKLGLCTAACFASAGHTVFGYDINDAYRHLLKSGGCIEETGLPDLLQSATANLHVVDSYDEAVDSAEIIMIIVPSPSMANGRFSNDYIVQALVGVAEVIKKRNAFCIVDIVSTVMPGSCDSVFRPLLESKTGMLCGDGFGLVYNPEFIALGSVIHNFLNPDLVLIGASDHRSGAAVRELYESTCKSSPVMAVMSLVNAEIAKISLNCYVTMKISFANRLAEMCEEVPGADVDVITEAIGADSRVGSKGLKAGLGFGGPCFPRDNIAFQSFAEEFSCDAILSKAVVAVNNDIPKRLFNTISCHCHPGAKISLLGLAYKPHTHIIEQSHSMALASMLIGAGYKLKLHDPKALGAAQQAVGATAECVCDPYECVAGCSAVALLTDWPEYRELDWCRIVSLLQPGALIIDSWRAARGNDLRSFVYQPLGIGMPGTEGYL